MAEVSGAELVALFEKASKAAERAAQKDGAVLAAEEARCTDALTAMGGVEVSTALLMSTQVGWGSFWDSWGLESKYLDLGCLALACNVDGVHYSGRSTRTFVGLALHL
jgi:hypothetical protein